MPPARIEENTGRVTLRVGWRTCTRCQATVLVGRSSEVCYWDVRADPRPVSLLEEYEAALRGIEAYDLVHTAMGHYQFACRDSFRISGTTPEQVVVLAHRCTKG